MDTKHTKGPWTRSGREGDHVYIYHSDDRGGAASLVVAKVTCRDAWEPEQMANAHLIAAAPDLLEALRKVSAALEAVYESEMEWTGEWNMLPPDALELAKAAIRKAEGE